MEIVQYSVAYHDNVEKICLCLCQYYLPILFDVYSRCLSMSKIPAILQTLNDKTRMTNLYRSKTIFKHVSNFLLIIFRKKCQKYDTFNVRYCCSVSQVYCSDTL